MRIRCTHSRNANYRKRNTFKIDLCPMSDGRREKKLKYFSHFVFSVREIFISFKRIRSNLWRRWDRNCFANFTSTYVMRKRFSDFFFSFSYLWCIGTKFLFFFYFLAKAREKKFDRIKCRDWVEKDSRPSSPNWSINVCRHTNCVGRFSRPSGNTSNCEK